ncbi:hypothetical protein AVEN_272672-1 [Araneus ventricosus]|uniref:Uncharacterized protein n=1 Tax=Araneus ventricosus TaxID=182803 RepID=A0A4Y2NNJ5_ARAVE|nr:hypothetical protein AVEN_272672-1 [Araneus ventricosus]
MLSIKTVLKVPCLRWRAHVKLLRMTPAVILLVVMARYLRLHTNLSSPARLCVLFCLTPFKLDFPSVQKCGWGCGVRSVAKITEALLQFYCPDRKPTLKSPILLD